MKPFRLINALELAQIRQRFAITVQNWQEQYACMPLTVCVELPDSQNNFCSDYHFKTEHECVAMIQGNLDTFVQIACLGSTDSNFTSLIHPIVLQLLKTLCNTQDGNLIENHQFMPWLYYGSTSLLVRLETMDQSIELLLHPSHCKSMLPLTTLSERTLVPRDQAVAMEILKLNAALNSWDIALLELLNLQPGDLLITKHKFNQPLVVQHNHEVITNSQLGNTNNFKSILIKRKS